MGTDLHSAGVQMFFVGGRNYLLCEVFVGEHESPTFRKWYECGNLHYSNEETPYRDVLMEDGKWYKATWNDHFEAWIVDYNTPTSDPWNTPW